MLFPIPHFSVDSLHYSTCMHLIFHFCGPNRFLSTRHVGSAAGVSMQDVLQDSRLPSSPAETLEGGPPQGSWRQRGMDNHQRPEGWATSVHARKLTLLRLTLSFSSPIKSLGSPASGFLVSPPSHAHLQSALVAVVSPISRLECKMVKYFSHSTVFRLDGTADYCEKDDDKCGLSGIRTLLIHQHGRCLHTFAGCVTVNYNGPSFR